MTDYLDYVVETVEQLIERQSARLGGKSNGALFITCSNRRTGPSYRSLGVKTGNTYRTCERPEPPFESKPFRLDLPSWPILDLLSDIAGSPKYRNIVSEMAEAFAHHGFNERSGLGYFGESADFDVLRVRPAAAAANKEPLFKPNNFDNCPGLPLERLWTHAPAQMARTFKAAYYGLVTDPERMDYNRYCQYDFDDTARKPSMKPNSGFLAFLTAGARLIHWWGAHFARTGDVETLGWAQKMCGKWQAVQCPASGLAPSYFGGKPGEGTTMPPCQHANVNNGLVGSVALLDGADEFRKRSEGVELAEKLTNMALRLSRGIAKHAYDSDRGGFPMFLGLNGGFWNKTVRYTFLTQEEKDEAVKNDPLLREVPVFDVFHFYENGDYSRHFAGTGIPYHVAICARKTDDAYLLTRAREFAEMFMDARS